MAAITTRQTAGGGATVAGIPLTNAQLDTNFINLNTELTGITSSKTANTIYAAPNGSAGVPTFRSLVAADVPTLNQSTTGSAGTLLYEDNRTISPSELTSTRLKFGFTSWNNNNGTPYADFLHLRSYTDASGGNGNLVMFRKDAIGMRIWQQTFDSATAYATFKDVAFTDGTGATGTWGISVSGNAATVTNGVYTNTNQTISGIKIFSSGLVTGDTQGYPDYEFLLDFGADVAGTWRKLVTVSTTTGLYFSAGFKIEITEPQTNHATTGSVNSIKEEIYYVACVRTNDTVQDTPDACYVTGPSNRIRAIKTSTGNYEIQIQNAGQYVEYRGRISVYAINGTHTVTYSNGTAVGVATATYTATVNNATTWVQRLGAKGQIISDVVTGTAPFTVASTTAVTNLNADLLDGNHASAFAGVSQTMNIGTTAVAINRASADLALTGITSVAGTTSLQLIGTGANSVSIVNNGITTLTATSTNRIAIGATSSASTKLRVLDTVAANSITQGIYSEYTVDDTEALTAIRQKFGIRSTVDVNDKTNESFDLDVYGVNGEVNSNFQYNNALGNFGNLYGTQGRVNVYYNDATYKKVSDAVGIQGNSIIYGSNSVVQNLIGVKAAAYINALGTASATTNLAGVWSDIRPLGGASATVTNTYFFYGIYGGGAATSTVTNAYGIHINATVNNYLGGGLKLGGTQPTGTSPIARLQLAGNLTTGSWTTNGAGIRAEAATYTDNSTAASDTVALAGINAIGRPTIAASNTGVIYTNAATLYIDNSPAQGTNVTITNPYSVYVANGTSYFGGGVTTPSLTASGLIWSVSATHSVQLGTDSGGSVSLGRVNNIASTPYIDFNSGATSTDFDVRLAATGGNGTAGNGLLTLSGNLSVTGNLTINGTTTTVNSTTVTVDDPIFTLGGDTAPASDDNKDRGIEFRYHNGTAAKIGFFGYDDSTGYLTFIPDATNTSEVFSGAQGDIQATNFRGALIGNASTATTLQTARNINGVSFNGSADITVADSTKLPLTGGTLTGGLTVPAPLTVNAQGTEGGEIVLKKGTGQTGLNGDVVIDTLGNWLRFFENGGAFRQFTIDFTNGFITGGNGIVANINGNAATATTAGNVTGTVAVGNGGTGVTTLTGLVKGNGINAFTAAAAGTDYTSPSSTETMTNKTVSNGVYSGTVDQTGSVRGGVTTVAALNIDCSLGNFFTKTIAANSTFTVSNVPASRAYAFTLELTHTSGTITWFSGVQWPGGTAPTLTTGKVHLFTFVTDDGGTSWRGASQVNYNS